jgi:class 3 adenylate cyclase
LKILSQEFLPKKAVFDFAKVDLKNATKISFNSEWAFYHKKLIDSKNIIDSLQKSKLKKEQNIENWESFLKEIGKFSYEAVPSEWIDYKDKEGKSYVDNFDYGSFILLVKNLPQDEVLAFSSLEQGTAFNFYYFPLNADPKTINYLPFFKNGVVGDSLKNSIPQILPVYKEVYIEEPTAILLVQVSNFHHRQGGFWSPIQIGYPEKILKSEESQKAITFISIGVVIIMGLYHFVLFFQRKEDKGSLLFGLFCFIILIRTASTDRVFHNLFRVPSEAQFEALYKLEYMSFYFAAPLFLNFIIFIFRKNNLNLKPDLSNTISWSIVAVFCLTVVFLPARYFSFYIKYYYIYSLIFMFYMMILILNSTIQKMAGAFYSLIGSAILSGFVVHDQLYSLTIIHTGYYAQYGLVVFIFAQSLILSSKFAIAFRESESLNESMSRFVPTAFLKLLHKNTFLDIQLGNTAKKDLTILFFDIRGFTSIAEKLSTEDTFKLLNEVFGKLNPFITKNNGTIDKYIGDAVMALFEDPESAIQSAIEIQLELTSFNYTRRNSSLYEIEIGIGINSGNVILGTVGTVDRMNTTVIGDTVNLAARLENLNKLFKTKILISEKTISKLKNPNQFYFREIAIVRVKGKQEETSVFEVFDYNTSDIIQLKKATLEDLDYGLMNYRNGYFKDAGKFFKKVLEKYPNDVVANYYIKRLEFFNYTPPSNWSGIEDQNIV